MLAAPEAVQSSEHGQLYVWTDAEMIARGGQSAHPCNCAHAKVFTNVFASASIQHFTRFASHGHLIGGFLVRDRIVLLIVFSDSSRLDECRWRAGDSVAL